MFASRMDEATELKLLEEMLLVGKDDGIHLDDVEVASIDYESALQVVAASFHSESRAFPLIANRGAPSSFKGRAAVDWMVDQFLLKKRDEAVFIGQTLMDRQFVRPRPKKTLLDDLISANKDSKTKDSGRGDAEEIGTFADSDDKQYNFQKAPLMMDNYIRKHLPISVTMLLKEYPPPARSAAVSPPGAQNSPFLSPRARSSTSFSLTAMTRSSSTRSFTDLPVTSTTPTTSSSSTSSSSASKPFTRRHGRSASVTLTGSSLTVPLKHNTTESSPLASPVASPRKISKARRASLVIKEKFLIFRENREKSDGVEDKEEWERGGDGEDNHINHHSNIITNNTHSSSDSDESSSDDSSDDLAPPAAVSKNNNYGSGSSLLSIPSARRRASVLFSPLRLGKDSSSASSSSAAATEEGHRDSVKKAVARRLLDENGFEGAADTDSGASNSSSPRASSSSRPGSPTIMPSPRASSSSPQLTLDKLREASTKKVHAGRLRGKSNADLKTTPNPLYGTAALDLEEMVREREERSRAKQERREARRIRREERRRRRAEAGLSCSPDTSGETSVREAAACDGGGNRSGPASPAHSPTPVRDRRSPHSPRTAPRSSRKSSLDRDSITFAAVDEVVEVTPGGEKRERRGSEGMILSSPTKDSIDKKRTEEKEEGAEESTTQQRRGRLRRASSLRVSSGSLILGRSSDKKDKDKEKDKDKDNKDKIRKDSSGGKKEEDKLHRRKGGSFIKPRGSRDDIDEVGSGRGATERGRQSPELQTAAMRLPTRELPLADTDCSGDKSKRKRNLTPHSVALPIAQRMSVGVRSRAATLDIVDSSADEGDATPPPPPSQPASTTAAAATAGAGKPTTRTDS